jgi:hypothetical protein
MGAMYQLATLGRAHFFHDVAEIVAIPPRKSMSTKAIARAVVTQPDELQLALARLHHARLAEPA